MKFAVSELKSLSNAVRSLSARDCTALSAMLQRRQPDFFEIIDEVGTDPRCARAHLFCTMFSALAFGYAERAAGYRLPKKLGELHIVFVLVFLVAKKNLTGSII